MPSLTMAQGLLGHLTQGSDPPAKDLCATTPHVRLPISSSLRAILAAGAGGRSTWGWASGRRATREVGGEGAGKAGSEVWSREIGGSDTTSNTGMDEDEGDHALMTASPWSTQESGERGLRGDARAGRSDGRKGTSTMADGGVTQGCHGARREQGEGKGGCRGWKGVETWGVKGNSGGRKASRVDPELHGVEWEEGGRIAS